MEPPANFRFVEPGRIALSGAPETPSQVDWLYEQGIRAVLSLHPVSDAVARRLEERGIAWLPLLVPDLTSEAAERLATGIAFIERSARDNPACLIH